MSQVFNEEGSDRVLLIDATNAFNQMNRAVAMHNIRPQGMNSTSESGLIRG